MEGKLRPCSDCGNMVSIRAESCPNCGAPQEDKVRPCPDCGKLVSIHAEACPNCGAPQNQDSSLDEPAPPLPEPIQGERRKSGSGRKLIVFLSVAVLLVLLGVVVVTQFIGSRPDPKGQATYDYWKRVRGIDLTNSLSEEDKINRIKALPKTNVDKELLDHTQRDMKIRTEMVEFKKEPAPDPFRNLAASQKHVQKSQLLSSEFKAITDEIQPLLDRLKKRYGIDFTK